MDAAASSVRVKSLGELQRDLARTRTALGETLHALEERLSPQQILERGVTMSYSVLDQNTGKLADLARRHPILIALAAGTLGCAIFAQTRAAQEHGPASRRVGRALRHGVEDMGVHAGWLVERVNSVARGARASRPRAVPRATGSAEPMAGYGAGAAQTTEPVVEATARDRHGQEETMSMIGNHPLVIGALVLLTVAAVTILMPAGRGAIKTAAREASAAVAGGKDEEPPAPPSGSAAAEEALARTAGE